MAIEITIDRYIGSQLSELETFRAETEDIREAVIAALDSANDGTALTDGELFYGDGKTRGLSYVVLADRDLSNGNFANIDFDSTDFYNATLRGTDFSNAKFEDMFFCGADLRGANFENAQVRRSADFSNADLREVKWNGAKIGKAKFFGAILDEKGLEYALSRGGRLFKNPFKNLKARLGFSMTKMVSHDLICQFSHRREIAA